ncbi:MAG: glycosyltransferase, partial [Actinomycetota bacterium]|nr:glycosyltransferase [Actinomycetota bacterium]
VEYLWCGLPVIYNDYSELSELIAEYDAGWTLEPDDSEAIRRVLAEIFDDRAVVSRKSDNAQRLARERLAWDATITPLDESVRRPSLRRSARWKPFAGIDAFSSPLDKVRFVYREEGARAVFAKSVRLAQRTVSERIKGAG